MLYRLDVFHFSDDFPGEEFLSRDGNEKCGQWFGTHHADISRVLDPDMVTKKLIIPTEEEWKNDSSPVYICEVIADHPVTGTIADWGVKK